MRVSPLVASLLAGATATLLAACAPGPGTATRAPSLGERPGPGAGTCPDAGDVGIALALRDEADARTRLVLPQLTVAPGASGLPPLAAPVGGGATFAVLAPEAAVALGARESDAPIWLWSHQGGPPCQATAGEHLAIRRSDGTVSIAREVTGGCDPAEVAGARGWALAAQTFDAPRRCEAGFAVEVAASSAGDPLPMGFPAEVGARLAGGRCAEPCDLRWRVFGVRTDFGGGAYEVSVAEVTPTRGAGPCDYAATEDRWVVFMSRYGRGAVLPGASELVGVLADDTGVRTVVSRGAGDLRVHALEPEAFALHEARRLPLELGASRAPLAPVCTLPAP